MTPLTKTDWMNMWASVMGIEYDVNELRKVSRTMGPHTGKQLRATAISIENEVNKIKTKIQDALGERLE